MSQMRYDNTITTKEAWAFFPDSRKPFSPLEFGLKSLRYEFVQLAYGDMAIIRSTRSRALYAVKARRVPKWVQKRRRKFIVRQEPVHA